MKNLQTFVIALPLLIVSSLASAVSVSGNVALTSDYIWRGWTQSAGGPAVSGGFDLSTDSGFYIGTWGSSVQFGDAATSDTTEMELDVYLGYSTDIADNISLDVGYITYTYPGATDANFDEAYIGFDIYGFGISYASGMDDAAVTRKYLMLLMLVQEVFQYLTVITKILVTTFFLDTIGLLVVTLESAYFITTLRLKMEPWTTAV